MDLLLICLGMKALTESGRKFIAKVNSAWWKDLADVAKSELGPDDGDYVILYSDELEQHFMMYNSRTKKGKIKKKCVLTNAFVNLPPKKNALRMFVSISCLCLIL
jgi:hypothetical protein